MRPGRNTTTRPSIGNVAVSAAIVFLMLFGFQFVGVATLPQNPGGLPTVAEAAQTALVAVGVLAVCALAIKIVR